MGAIDLIRQKAAKYWSVVVEEKQHWISVRPEGDHTFTVGLREKENGFTVFYEGWHEEIELEKDALEFFARGLSASARLKVVAHGGHDHQWTAEFWEEETWQRGNITGLFIFPFWRTKRVRYLQNDLIPENSAQ